MRNQKRIQKICRIGLFTAFLAISAWIHLPLPVPITLQTLILFTMAATLPTSEAIGACLVYLMIGIVGLPIFAGFQGGIGTLLGPTGGFLIGMLPTAAFYAYTCKKFSGTLFQILVASASLLILYICGCLWYAVVYGGNSAVAVCVIPFIIPDMIKIGISIPLSKRLKKILK